LAHFVHAAGTRPDYMMTPTGGHPFVLKEVSAMRGVIWAVLLFVPALIAGLVTAAVILTPLPEPDNPEATEVVAADGKTVVARIYTEDRLEIPVHRMPKHLLDAIVAIEDDRFYKHRGIDPVGILRAMVRNLRAGQIVEGGSTLTQQLARNLTFDGRRLGLRQTLDRKIKEAILTLKLERRYSKEQILGLYWNTVYLGRGAYGLERAAQVYLGKSALAQPDGKPLDLTLAEAALLASLPQAPEWYSKDDPEAQAALKRRRDLVLTRMAEQGYITPAEAEAAKAEPIVFAPPRQEAEVAPYFLDYVRREIRERFPRVAANLSRGGYRVVTTLDPEIQAAAERAVAEGLAALRGSPGEEPEAALVALDPETGEIRAMVGGRDADVALNRALEPRQPGSTFKPFVYAAALATRQYTAISTQVDEEVKFPGRAEGEYWVVRNWEGSSSKKPENMRTALKLSLNTVTAAWMNVLKPDPVIRVARSVGLDAEYPEDLTIGLGTVSVSPLQMAAAYAALANGGFRVRPMAVLRIEDRNGNVLASQTPVRHRALEPGVAFIVTDMLKSVLKPGGTGYGGGAMLGGRPAAGKSGTTDESVDAWFVGYTPDLVAAVWTGYDDRRATRLLGGRDVSPIWGRFMRDALAGLPPKDWSAPPDVSLETLCSKTGLRPNPTCPTFREWFLRGTAPVAIDTRVHWDQMAPALPGIPLVPQGLLP